MKRRECLLTTTCIPTTPFGKQYLWREQGVIALLLI